MCMILICFVAGCSLLVARCSLQCMYGGCTVSFLVDRARVCFYHLKSKWYQTFIRSLANVLKWFLICGFFILWIVCVVIKLQQFVCFFVMLVCRFVAWWSLFMLNIAKGKTLSSGKSIHSHFFSHDKGLFIATKITFKNRIGWNEETIHN